MARLDEGREIIRELTEHFVYQRTHSAAVQADALIHNHLPITGLLGIMCYTDAMKKRIERDVAARGLTLPAHARPGWYFQ
ncbi:DUF4433 domain-containing protein [Pseudomonas sp. B21-056]|jgi:hypothetical protein|uniref:DUF4433 domain-containing protein n=1 Tax=Pseudomonas sp. B21-056 TaxID=2895495 RepID=UPI0022302F53|nr:DUF4433 domain-containing protein [Pseudomonas sp. B21-056]